MIPTHPSPATPGRPTGSFDPITTGELGVAILSQNFGKTLREAREKAGITQQTLADKLRVTQGWISQLESGTSTLRNAEDVEAYAEALGMPIKRMRKAWEPIREILVLANLRRAPVIDRSLVVADGPFSRVTMDNLAADRREIAPGICLGTLVSLLQKDDTARTVIKAMCAAYERASGKGPR